MADSKQKNTSENFDREFSLAGNKKHSGTGRIPSWIMILAGAAIIAAVVIVRQPSVRQNVNVTRASVTSQNSLTVQGSESVFSGSDAKADPAELEARFGTKVSDYQGTAASFFINDNDLLYSVQLDELPVDENGKLKTENSETDGAVYWVDEKPFAVSLEPAETTNENLAELETNSVYWIDEKPYDVTLEQVSSDEMAGMTDKELSEIVKAGDTYYRLQVSPAASSPDNELIVIDNSSAPDDGNDVTIGKSGNDDQLVPDEDPFGTESTAETPAAIAWVNGKPYAVTVKPYDSSADADNSRPGTDKSVIPVTVIGELDKKTAVFQSEGKQYEIQAVEIDTEKYSVEGTAQPVVWIDDTPLHVTLDPADSDSFNIILESVPEEEIPYLYETHFGKSYPSNEKVSDPYAGSQKTTEDTFETNAESEGEPEKGNWFVNVFHNIFGGEPTATPTPQVTLIAVEPTAIPKGPTATPIVVRMAPTSTPRGPIRLDEGEDYTGGSSDQKAAVPTISIPVGQVSKGDDGIEIDPALQSEDNSGSGDEPAIIIYSPSDADHSSVSVPVTVVENKPESAGNPAPTVPEPTPEELPHTGMAENWNIPSMIALLFGLLLVIIGVRRMRLNR